MALEVVGSTPINHPIKQKHPVRGAFALWEIGAGGRTAAVQRNSPVGCFDRRRPNGGYAPVRIDPINHFISVRGAFALWEIGAGGRTEAVLVPQISK